MASFSKEIVIQVSPEEVWAAIRDVGAVQQRLTPGVLVDSYLDGDARVVTFASGTVARELIVDLDDQARRFVYAVVQGGRTMHHNASWQVFALGEKLSRLVWITDFLPDEVAPIIQQLVEQGAAEMKQTLEACTKDN